MTPINSRIQAILKANFLEKETQHNVTLNPLKIPIKLPR